MAEQDNIQLVRKVYDAWNAHDPKRVAASFDETFVAESDTLPAPTRGTEGVRKFVEMYLHAFPDLHFTIEQILATGPYVITRWHGTGTHRGELMGIPPSNKRGEGIHGCTVNEIKNGKVAREWAYWDVASLLRQIGALPASATGR